MNYRDTHESLKALYASDLRVMSEINGVFVSLAHTRIYA